MVILIWSGCGDFLVADDWVSGLIKMGPSRRYTIAKPIEVAPFQSDRHRSRIPHEHRRDRDKP